MGQKLLQRELGGSGGQRAPHVEFLIRHILGEWGAPPVEFLMGTHLQSCRSLGSCPLWVSPAVLGSCNTQPCLRGVYRHCGHENLRVIRVMGYPRLPAKLLRVNEAAQPWDIQWPPLDVLWGPLCCCTKG